MRHVVSVLGGLALGAVLAVMPVTAQTMSPDPGPEEERMPAMMQMMREMRRDMDQMRRDMEQMRGDQMPAMRGRMGGMATRMDRMTAMMERHQRRLESGCPMLAPGPKNGR
jgi:hypothetical protein